ncbi:hypothetical protein SAMN04488527_1423 [Aliiroseovarius crassostreae]|nr:hypothetical protein SAMN04488527_1423 [Aliiroseovarius crassostreae]
MRMKSGKQKATAEKVVTDIRRKSRQLHSSEEKIRIVLKGLHSEDSIAELCRPEGIEPRRVCRRLITPFHATLPNSLQCS